jgi:hypothetical protein
MKGVVGRSSSVALRSSLLQAKNGKETSKRRKEKKKKR